MPPDPFIFPDEGEAGEADVAVGSDAEAAALTAALRSEPPDGPRLRLAAAAACTPAALRPLLEAAGARLAALAVAAELPTDTALARHVLDVLASLPAAGGQRALALAGTAQWTDAWRCGDVPRASAGELRPLLAPLASLRTLRLPVDFVLSREAAAAVAAAAPGLRSLAARLEGGDAGPLAALPLERLGLFHINTPCRYLEVPGAGLAALASGPAGRTLRTIHLSLNRSDPPVLLDAGGAAALAAMPLLERLAGRLSFTDNVAGKHRAALARLSDRAADQ